MNDSLDAIARIYFDGFSTTVLHQHWYPGGASPSAREKYICRLRNDLSPGDSSSSSSVQVYLKVVELAAPNGEEPEIIAFAKWKFVKESLPVEVYDMKREEITQEELGEGVNLDLMRTFMGKMDQFRRETMRGERCLHLGTFVCHPNHRGLGAASALLQWGVELADKEQVPAFLEASPHAYSLYKKFGFEDIDMYQFPLEDTGLIDEKDLGAEMCRDRGEKPLGFHRTAIMRRLPR
ncbi:hypothetical protein N0V82_005293 [Gnomoniopsis sp. IMI 355080]|nr:hypothetical protein N0V82_005293 [Gnomoniopsis sp. IMI 355080]